MRPPINSHTSSYVEYPTAIFSLERHEIYPYERFAFKVLHVAAEALNQRSLPDRISVSFSDGTEDDYWWVFNAGIRPLEHLFGIGVSGFHISTTPVAPLILFGMSRYARKHLFPESMDLDRKTAIAELKAFLDEFGSKFMESLRLFKSDGLASCIRRFTELTELQIWDVNDAVSLYDILVSFIANHEVAHAYVGQLTTTAELSERDHRAFEFIVDTLATEWIYKKMIVNTPDTDAYREFRGADSHADSIRQNSFDVAQGQVLTFLVFAFAGALVNRGRVVLDGGDVHPHSLVRCLIQRIHFMTLLQSNFAGVLAREDFTNLDQFHNFYFSVFSEAGLLTLDDTRMFMDLEVAEDLLRAYQLVDEFEIERLQKSRELFRMMGTDIRDKAKSGKGVSLLPRSLDT